MPTAKAGAQSRVPVPSPPRRHGGRRGRWGQARLVGAGEAHGGRKPPGQIPSQQRLRVYSFISANIILFTSYLYIQQ
jgi:hypothetical protein